MLSPVTLQQITDSKLERNPARNLLRLVLLGSCYLEAGAGVRFLPAVTDRECPGAKGRRARRKYGIAYALSGQAIFVGDTPVKMLVPGNGKKKVPASWPADEMNALGAVMPWSCRAYVPVSALIYRAFRSNAMGLLPYALDPLIRLRPSGLHDSSSSN